MLYNIYNSTKGQMLISIDEGDLRPLYQQIVAQVKDQVQRGELRPGDELPSVRDLADSLGINLHTVRSAYLRLREQGVVEMRLGRRARIAKKRSGPITSAEAESALGAQVKELAADAYLLGVTKTELHALLDRHWRDSDARKSNYRLTEDDK